MTSYEMQPTGSHAGKHEETAEHIGGFYRCLIALGSVQLFCGIAALALGIANAIICGMLGSIGYGIWGSLIVRRGVSSPLTIIRKILIIYK